MKPVVGSRNAQLWIVNYLSVLYLILQDVILTMVPTPYAQGKSKEEKQVVFIYKITQCCQFTGNKKFFILLRP